MSSLNSVGYFLVSTFFALMIFALWLRIALAYFRVSTLHPISQIVHKITNPIINPLNSLLKRPAQPKKYDWTSFGVLVVVEFFKILILCLILFHAVLPLWYLLVHVVADLIIQPCDYLFYALLIRVILSFTNPNWRHPIVAFIVMVTEPLLMLGRRILPTTTGFDFSPFLMMIILKVISLVLSRALIWQLL